MKRNKRKWWRISVSGYGEYAFYGTQSEAEQERSHKAFWEGGVGAKETIPATHSLAKEAISLTKFEHRNGYGLGERELSSIGVEEQRESEEE